MKKEFLKKNGSKKFLIVGNFGVSKTTIDGQTLKTRILANEIENELGYGSVSKINTSSKTGPSLFYKINCLTQSFFKCNHLIILPGQKSLLALSLIAFLFVKLAQGKSYYFVIGGWLPRYIKNRIFLRFLLRRLDGIYLEDPDAAKELKKSGLIKSYFIPNFREREKAKTFPTEKRSKNDADLKVCTLSRVSREKGISIAVEAASEANKVIGSNKIKLDIFGPIQENYNDEFKKLIKDHNEFVRYMGPIDPERTTDFICCYNALLFPTYYEGEGFPGTLIDAMLANVPVIASDWRYNSHIILQGHNGVVFKKKSELKDYLIYFYENPIYLDDMKAGCSESAKKYFSDNIIREWLRSISASENLES